MDDLVKLTNVMVERAVGNGRKKAREALEDHLARALKDGAGVAHKMTAIDAALPPLRLVMAKANTEGKKEFVADPTEVANIHSMPWEGEWGAYHHRFEEACWGFF